MQNDPHEAQSSYDRVEVEHPSRRAYILASRPA
jgi:hypothetical protein